MEYLFHVLLGSLDQGIGFNSLFLSKVNFKLIKFKHLGEYVQR